MTLRKSKKRLKKFVIGNSDKDADWLKHLANGRYKKEDLEATDKALKEHKDGKKSGKGKKK